jgi:nucleoid DNA-binding protein/DNA-dependent RNA polymerase auxiliary subunit epsilon
MTKDKFASELTKEMKVAGIKFNVEKAEKLIAAISKSMSEGLSSDRNLIVSNFGSFEVVRFGAKIINSPRGDNKTFFMPPTDVVKWHPSGKIRVRAASSEVSADEYQALIGNASFEDVSPVVLARNDQCDKPPMEESDLQEVKVNFRGKPKSYLSDENSPISKFVKSIFSLMKTFGADKLEISPGRTETKILYYSGSEAKNQRSLPKDTHSVIVEKIESLAGASNELLLFGTDRIKLKRKLTPFGNQLIAERI